MKAAFFLLILFLIPVLPASAVDSSPAGGAGSVHIAELYSDLESFDVTLYSDRSYENLTLEVILLRQAGNDEKVLASQVFPVDSLPSNTRVIKVGFWDKKCRTRVLQRPGQPAWGRTGAFRIEIQLFLRY
jgi:hypothetical protein